MGFTDGDMSSLSQSRSPAPGERGGQEIYLVCANGTERRFLYGRGDGFSFGPLSYGV